jgi:hypothetical protein
MPQVLAVTFVNAEGQETLSRFFTTMRAARKWAKWLASQRFAQRVRIMAGGPGGMEVK